MGDYDIAVESMHRDGDLENASLADDDKNEQNPAKRAYIIMILYLVLCFMFS